MQNGGAEDPILALGHGSFSPDSRRNLDGPYTRVWCTQQFGSSFKKQKGKKQRETPPLVPSAITAPPDVQTHATDIEDPRVS
jgi:hypothetical protein